MSSVAPSPPEQSQLVSAHSRQWIVNDVRASTLPPPALKPDFNTPKHLPGAKGTRSTEAHQVAVEKAEAGEEITTAVAKEIVAEAKKKRKPRRRKAVPTDKLGLRYREKRKPDDLSDLACQLREFAGRKRRSESKSVSTKMCLE